MENTNIIEYDPNTTIPEVITPEILEPQWGIGTKTGRMKSSESNFSNVHVGDEATTEVEDTEMQKHVEEVNKLCPSCGTDITVKENLVIFKSARKTTIPGSRKKYQAVTASCKHCMHDLGFAGIVPVSTQAYTPKANAKEIHLKKRRAAKKARKANRHN